MESANVSGFRKICNRNPQMSADSTNCKWIQNFVYFELAYEQLKTRAGILIYSNAEFKGNDLTIVSGMHERISKRLLTKNRWMSAFSILETQHPNSSIFGFIGLRVYGNTTLSISSI